jgi:hypothetical protein
MLKRLDADPANKLLIAAGMGKPTRNDILADYLRAAGVAAVWINADGHVGAQDVAKGDLLLPARRSVRARLLAPAVDAGSSRKTRPGRDSPPS